MAKKVKFKENDAEDNLNLDREKPAEELPNEQPKNKVSYATNTVIIILQSGSCAVQFVFMATHTKDVLEQYESNINWDPKIHLLLLLMPVILLTFIHSIQILSLLSTFGNLTMVVNFFIIIAVISGRKRELYSPSITTDLFSTILASGSILYAFEGQAMVLPMENKMSDPGAMLGCNGVLPTGMITVMSIYAFTGLFGYLAFGDHVKPSVTLNLDHNNIWFTVVKLALVVAVFIGLALRLFLIIQMLWPTIKRNLKHGLTRRYLVTEHVFRALFVTQTFLIAVAVPKLELIIPLVGVTGGMLLAFVFPALIELVTYWEDWKNTKMTALFVVKDIFLISVGIFGFIAGTYSNVHELAHHLSD